MQSSTLASERDGEFHQGRNAGTVDLWNVVQVNDQLPRALLHEVVGEIVEMLAGLADGEPALDLKVVNPAGFARRNFEWWMKRHEGSLSSIQFNIDVCQPQGAAAALAALALYDEGYGEQIR
jgi:hypothetical protein